MKKIVVHFLVLAMNFYLISGIPLPPYIEPCYEKDPNIDQCAVESARKAIPELVKGDPVYNIPKMNPMHIDVINLEVSNLKLTSRNVTVKGLETAIPRNFHLDVVKRNLKFELFLPILDISSEYNLNGQLLIFPIQGTGLMNIKYINGTYVYNMHYNVLERKNRRYINTTIHNLVLDCEQAYFKFTNLFNGNKLLGDQIQRFMDENWKEVNVDIGPLIAQAIDSIAFFTSHSILKYWLRANNTALVSKKVVLMYFLNQSKIYKSLSLWSLYLKLKCMLRIKNNIDITNFPKLAAFLKNCSVGSSSEKKEQLITFFVNALNDKYLLMKVKN